MIKNRKYIYPFIWLGFLIYASVTPSNKIPEFKLFMHADKVIHFIFYFVFTILLVPAFFRGKGYISSYLKSLLISILVGIAFELIQHYFSAGRTGTIGDVIANTLGAVSGLLFYSLAIKRKYLERIFF